VPIRFDGEDGKSGRWDERVIGGKRRPKAWYAAAMSAPSGSGGKSLKPMLSCCSGAVGPGAMLAP
jgi:hypothetical protein